MKNLLLCVLFFAPCYLFAQAGNSCASATSILTSVGTCTSYTSTVAGATRDGSTTNCQGTVKYDVWYKFVALTPNPTISFTSIGTAISNPGLQVLSGCGGTSMACGGTSITPTTLTVGSTYLIRIFSTGTTAAPSTNNSFSICVLDPPPVNDNCANAIAVVPATSCLNKLVNQSLNDATVEGSGIATSCGGTTLSQDVWYKFVANSSFPTITVDNLGSSWGSRLRIQLLSGACGAMTEVACASNSPLTPSTALALGSTYYIRVLKNNATAPTGGNDIWSFDICVTGGSSRMSEVFQETILSPANGLLDPWEITYGPDNYLWLTEAKGYKVYRMDPSTGTKTTVLDISQGSTFFSTPADQAFNLQFDVVTKNPQGGLAGLALHPKFLDPVTPQNYVYISYIHTYDSVSAIGAGYGTFYTNSVVRFTYNTSTGKLESPIAICDTLPGSNDHNSQRLIVAPVGGIDYLFYAAGDMGAGQFTNQYRKNHAQNTAFYEGKILRFNLSPDLDGGAYDKWIPNDNPFNATRQSAIWALGIRNNQGFAYDTAANVLYGASHGPYSDDEINIIQRQQNYGHPLVIGFKGDHNYDNSSAGAPNATSACPLITDEVVAASGIANYKDPLFTAYPVPQSVVHNIWVTNPGNGGWPSEAWSGMGIYKQSYIPGWKNSLILCSLKWGRLIRLKLGNAGTSIRTTDGADTVTYFGSTNRYRDIALPPNGKDIYIVMDKSATTSGPSAANPVSPACPGCVIKYSFQGYMDVAGQSAVPDSIMISDSSADSYNNAAALNTLTKGSTVVINNINKNIWVPITGPDGNLLAEINANGNLLDTVKTTFYLKSGKDRQDASGRHYLNRSFTITPNVQPTLPGGSPLVKIRLYLTKAEFDTLNADPFSGVSSLSDLLIRKNNDANSVALTNTAAYITPTFSGTHANGYYLQANINSFSSFYIGTNTLILPVTLIDFKGTLQNNVTQLQWHTSSETNTSHFIVERSIDGRKFDSIGTVVARGNTTSTSEYDYPDADVTKQSSSIIYYRLKIMDRDNAFKYSSVITITLPSITGINLFPNPATEKVNVSLAAPEDGQLNWTLMDNAGRIVLKSNTQMKKGNNNFTINLNKLSSGLYYLSLSGAGIDEKIKLQKL